MARVFAGQEAGKLQAVDRLVCFGCLSGMCRHRHEVDAKGRPLGPKDAVTYVDGTALCIDCAAHAADEVAVEAEEHAEPAPAASPVRLAG
jgi:hypothetical protein